MIEDAHMPFLTLTAGRRQLIFCKATGYVERAVELARTSVFFRPPLLDDPRHEGIRAKIAAESRIPLKIVRYKATARDLESGVETDLSPDLPANASECSPYLLEDGRLQCIVTQGGRQWNRWGADRLVKPAFADTNYGFRADGVHVWATQDRKVAQWIAGEGPQIFAPPLPADAKIYRLAPIYGQPRQWLLTYISEQVGHTLHWDGAVLSEVLVEGSPVYKCSILDGEIAWSSGSTGRRTLEYGGSYTLGAPLDCASQPLMETPLTLLDLGRNFLGAFARFASSGLRMVPKDVFEQRLQICRTACPGNDWREDAMFGLGRCERCGCTQLKQWSAAEKCPVDAWNGVSQ